tara:strand:- start:904 stop:1869 length:966 start_codon:yes stop_codon:yes gene_type:complete
MKLIYIISMAHSGSTLADLTLGTHPEICSSGELRYLNWQLHRTTNKEGAVEDGDICSCLKDFRKCDFWSKVITELEKSTGLNIYKDPKSFDTAYFGEFAYKNRGGFTRSFFDKLFSFLVRLWCEKGYSYKKIPFLNKKISTWLSNNWLLYQTMSKVSGRKVVVDSSKHLMIALLLQQFKPKDVTLIFIHRSIKELAASHKKWALKKGEKVDFISVAKSKSTYEDRVARYKQNIESLKYIDIHYKDLVKYPADFLRDVTQKLKLKQDYILQPNEHFFIDPTSNHLVAGNPMRYKGKQQIKHDHGSKIILSNNDILFMKDLIK